MTRLALILTMFFALVGCATGSALVTGQARAAIEDHSTIQILTSMPAGAREIAIVKAERKPPSTANDSRCSRISN